MKQALITGCTRGLGFHLLERYLSDGWTVYPLVRSTESIEHLIENHPGRCVPIQCDVSGPDVSQKIQNILSANRAKISVIINNAGTGGGHEPTIKEVDIDLLSRMVSTHCIGAVTVVQAVLPFVVRGSSSVINVSSRLGSAQRNGTREFAGLGFSYTYRIAKASQNMASLCMSQDPGLDGVVVCSIHPGRLKTDSGAFDADTEPSVAAVRMKDKIDKLTPEDNGTYIDIENGPIPW